MVVVAGMGAVAVPVPPEAVSYHFRAAPEAVRATAVELLQYSI